MTPLSDALTAAQRRALQALEKAYVAGQLDAEAVAARLQECGVTDPVDTAYLLASLDVLKEWGAPLPAEPGAAKVEDATQKQWDLVRKLADEKNVPAPDCALTKATASQVIDELQAGTYDPEKWRTPF